MLYFRKALTSRILKIMMNKGSIVITSVVSFAIGTALTMPVEAQSVGSYSCDKNNKDEWATVVNQPSSKHEFITWRSNRLRSIGYDNERRCRDVSDKIEKNRLSGALRYMVPGMTNGHPTMCASESKQSRVINCPSERMLFTLKSPSDHNRIVQEILRNNTDVNPSAIAENGILSTNDQGYYVLDVKGLIPYLKTVNSSSKPPSDCIRGNNGLCIN